MTPNELREVRRRLGLSQSQFARALHVALNTVKCWEAGRRRVTPAMELLIFKVEGERTGK